MVNLSLVTASAPTTPYIGRFAPSPTGELHLGSLYTALASYLDARAHGGRWLVRMEDLDPPREQAGAADSILRCLEAHHLPWDGPVVYQSQRQQAYRQALQQLTEAGLTYPCDCNRQRLKQLSAYDGHCLRHPPQGQPAAIRVRATGNCQISFEDLFQGPQQEDVAERVGDFVVRRKDGLFAYQLAVVVDDIAQGITHIVRGYDLLDSSGRQHYLFGLFGQQPPHMGHLPVLVNDDGQKLSKQTFAEPLDPGLANVNLFRCLHALGQHPPSELRHEPASTLLQWGIDHWLRQRVPHQAHLYARDMMTLA